MKIDINTVDLLTETHKDGLRSKITQAIEAIDINTLKESLVSDMDLNELMYDVLDGLDKQKLSKIFENKLKEILK